MSIKGKTAVITGASRGIGKVIAQTLAALGANIVANYIGPPEEVKATVEACEALGVKCVAVEGDVTKFEDCEKLFERAKAEFETVDILVNNAGITRDMLIAKMTPEDFDAVINVNLKGTFNCTKLAGRIMQRQRAGRIISISSVIGLMGNIGQANYAASKAGIIGLTKTAAKEFGRRGITVNAIAPGFIETDMTAVLSDEVKASMMSAIPLAKLGSPQDVANTVAFLASEEAAYITGQVICVDGGMAM